MPDFLRDDMVFDEVGGKQPNIIVVLYVNESGEVIGGYFAGEDPEDIQFFINSCQYEIVDILEESWWPGVRRLE